MRAIKGVSCCPESLDMGDCFGTESATPSHPFRSQGYIPEYDTVLRMVAYRKYRLQRYADVDSGEALIPLPSSDIFVDLERGTIYLGLLCCWTLVARSSPAFLTVRTYACSFSLL